MLTVKICRCTLCGGYFSSKARRPRCPRCGGWGQVVEEVVEARQSAERVKALQGGFQIVEGRSAEEVGFHQKGGCGFVG